MLLGTIYSVRPLQDQSALPGLKKKTSMENIMLLGTCCKVEPRHTQTGFIQKNPFKIHKLFTNLCDMAQKSCTKVRNSFAHPVKGCNP